MERDMGESGARHKWLTTTLALTLFVFALTVLGWRLWNRQVEIDAKYRLEGPPPVEIPKDKLKAPGGERVRVR